MAKVVEAKSISFEKDLTLSAYISQLDKRIGRASIHR